MEIDLLKAICIIGMIFNHTFEDLGSYDSGAVGFLNEYLVVFVGASGFMIAMGIAMHYTRNQSWKAYAMRGFTILTVGQLLNLVRNVCFNLIVYWLTGTQWFIAQTLLVLQADILSFAGLSFLLMSLFKGMKLPAAVPFGFGLVMNIAAWPLSTVMPTGSSYLLRQLLGYFVLTNAESFFPLTSYFVLVAFGYWIGELYPRINDKDGLAKRILLICVPVYVAFAWIRSTVPIPFLPEFQSDLQYSLLVGPDALASCVVSMIMLALFHLIIKAAGGRVHPMFSHLSTHINQYYCISYVLILWTQTLLMAFRGTLWSGWQIPAIVALVIIVFCYVIIESRNRIKLRKEQKLQKKRLMAIALLTWTLTIVVTIYVYPRIDVYANVWNSYLLP